MIAAVPVRGVCCASLCCCWIFRGSGDGELSLSLSLSFRWRNRLKKDWGFGGPDIVKVVGWGCVVVELCRGVVGVVGVVYCMRIE